MNVNSEYVAIAALHAMLSAATVVIDSGKVVPKTIDCKVCKNCSTAVESKNAKCPECGKVL